jgi:hypothetical protein
VRVQLGAQGASYYVPSEAELLSLSEGLIPVLQISDILASILLSPPRNAEDWRLGLRKFSQAVEDLKPKGLASAKPEEKYQVPWMFRLWAISEMRAAGVQALWIPKDYALSTFSELFPDQKSWLQQIVQLCPTATVWQCMRWLQYSGPPELLSMYLCLLADDDIYKCTLDWIRQNSQQIKLAALEYLRQHNQNANVAVLLKKLSDKGQESFNDLADSAGQAVQPRLETQLPAQSSSDGGIRNAGCKLSSRFALEGAPPASFPASPGSESSDGSCPTTEDYDTN